MPRPYPPEFRARAIALVRAGKQAKQTAVELGIHPVTLSKWLRQDDIDNGLRPGVPSSESAELRAARRRVQELETELGIVRQAEKFLSEDKLRPKGCPVIERLVDAGLRSTRAAGSLGSRGSPTTSTGALPVHPGSCAASG